jgi:uncharacterized protein (DUF58 family)
MLLLDAGRTMAGSIGGASRFEYAIDAAVAVAELASRVGDQVGMVAFAGDVLALAEPRGGTVQARRILELLFDLEPSLEAPNYPRAFGALMGRHRRRALLVLLTELSDQAVMEPLLRAVPILLRHHLVIVGAVRDPEVEAMALSVPATSEEAYLKATAAGYLSARSGAADRLRRMGATVVDGPVNELAGHLTDQYLKIKAVGRL